MPLPLKKRKPTIDFAPNYDIFERLDAAIDLGKTDTTVVNLLRNNYLDNLAGAKVPEGFGLTSEDDLNKVFTNVEKPFTKPTPYFVAQALDDEARENNKLRNIISNRGREEQGFFSTTTAGGLIAHAMDPIEASVDFLMGLATGGIGNLLSKVNKTKNAAKVGLMAQKLKSKTFTKSLVEGVVANSAIEAHNAYSSKRAQKDYGVQDALISVIGGSVFMPAALYGIPKGGAYLKNKFEAHGLVYKTAVKDFLNSKMPNIDLIKKYYSKLADDPSIAPPDSIRAKYQYSPLDDINLRERKLYMAARNSDALIDVDNVGHHTFDSDFGDNVLHMTDDPNKAYNFAGDHLSSTNGVVHEFSVDPKRMINADDTIDSEVGEIIFNNLPEELRDIYTGQTSIKQGLDEIRLHLETENLDLKVMNDLNEALKSQGFDGFRYTMKNTTGDATGHGVAIFKGMDNKKYNGTSAVDRTQVPNISQEDATNHMELVNSKENDLGYSPVLKEEVEKAPKAKKATPEEIRKESLETIKQIEDKLQNIDEKFLSEADKQFLKMIKETTGDEILEDKASAEYLECLLKIGK